MSVALLVEVPSSGDTVVAVRFPDADSAMDWADQHRILELGRPRIVSKTEALQLLRGEG